MMVRGEHYVLHCLAKKNKLTVEDKNRLDKEGIIEFMHRYKGFKALFTIQ